MNANKEIIGKKRNDSFSFFGYPEKIETRKENIQPFHAQMKLRLFLFMRFTINHIPISLVIFHTAALRIRVHQESRSK